MRSLNDENSNQAISKIFVIPQNCHARTGGHSEYVSENVQMWEAMAETKSQCSLKLYFCYLVLLLCDCGLNSLIYVKYF